MQVLIKYECGALIGETFLKGQMGVTEEQARKLLKEIQKALDFFSQDRMTNGHG